MDEILKEIDDAFKLISTIPVTHDNVEIMAMAKHHLRNASSGLQILKDKENEKTEG